MYSMCLTIHPLVKFDFEYDYFEDTIGLTRLDTDAQKVLLEIDKDLWPYIKTKPMHGSQKIVSENKNSIIIQLLIHVNYEFKFLIMFTIGFPKFKNRWVGAARAKFVADAKLKTCESNSEFKTQNSKLSCHV